MGIAETFLFFLTVAAVIGAFVWLTERQAQRFERLIRGEPVPGAQPMNGSVAEIHAEVPLESLSNEEAYAAMAKAGLDTNGVLKKFGAGVSGIAKEPEPESPRQDMHTGPLTHMTDGVRDPIA